MIAHEESSPPEAANTAIAVEAVHKAYRSGATSTPPPVRDA